MSRVFIEVSYWFEVSYEHEQHLNDIKRDLLIEPINRMSGGGVVVEDGEKHIFGFSCKRVGLGEILKERVQ